MNIFFDDKIIKLTTKVEFEDGFKNYLLKSFVLEDILQELKKTSLSEVRLIGAEESSLFKEFLKKIKLVKAAGGIVINSMNQVLFIYRNNKWDLPKGRVEKNEALELAAVREVEEETGVENLEIINHIKTTYHIFKRNGIYKLKETFWYEMQTNFNGDLIPQIEEGITKVEWKSKNEAKNVPQNSYRNIKCLLNEFYISNPV
jgi:8-oxo-dGTP pyrophosphatase MutT (NUDIX family)